MFDRIVPQSCTKMDCVTCDVKTAMRYNAEWHSRLPQTNMGNMLRNREKVFYAAVFELNYFAVAMWTTPVAANRLKGGNNMLELRRLAIAPDAPKYTATWMLGKMVRHIRRYHPNINKLISYQDTEVHSGTIYAAGNWSLESTSDYTPWNTDVRVRTAAVQSKASKNRWSYNLT